MSDPGAVVWFTGLPASGKSTLAARAYEHLANPHRCVLLLDGDVLRPILHATGYAPNERDAFYRSLGALAVLLASQGAIVLVAATAPRRAHRDAARETAPKFIEVWVRTPLAEAEARDPKGLYRAARRDPANMLPGVGEVYEPPAAPEVIAEGGLDEVAVYAIESCIDQRAELGAARGGA